VHPLEKPLYQLQQIDSQIAAAEREQARLDPGEREQARLAEIEAEAQALAEESSRLEHETRQAEARLQGVEEKHASHKKRLMSGEVKNARELEALELEVASLFQSRVRLDDQLLSLMRDADSLAARQAEVDARLAKARKTLDVKHSIYLKRKEELETQLRELRAARGPAADLLDAATLKRYQAIAERRDGIAVERVVGASTDGCHTTIPSKVIRLLREAEGFQFCEECGRFLVFIDV
jgi:predicted  nucleic acid-binding Zn-ribbon protein